MLSLFLLVPLVYAVNVTHYAPRSTNLNNLTYVLNGTTDAPGIFNTSTTPDSEYGTYNWCNMPHVRVREYVCGQPKYQYFRIDSNMVVQNSLLEIHPRIRRGHSEAPQANTVCIQHVLQRGRGVEL